MTGRYAATTEVPDDRSRALRWAILYDSHVEDLGMITHVLWRYTPAGCDIWCNEGLADLVVHAEFVRDRQIFSGVYRTGTIEELDISQLGGMIVLRSHPEVFGPQIRAARVAGVLLTVFTIESFDWREAQSFDEADEPSLLPGVSNRALGERRS